MWLQRQNETLTTDKYLTINQPQTSKKYRKKYNKNPTRALQQKKYSKDRKKQPIQNKTTQNNSYDKTR